MQLWTGMDDVPLEGLRSARGALEGSSTLQSSTVFSLVFSLDLGVCAPQTQPESKVWCERGLCCATRAQGLCAEEGTAGDYTHVNPHHFLEYPGRVSASYLGHKADIKYLVWQIRDTSWQILCGNFVLAMECTQFRPQSISEAHAIECKFLLESLCVLLLQTLPLQ